MPTGGADQPLPNLVVPRPEAEAVLLRHTREGQLLHDEAFKDFDEWRNRRKRWILLTAAGLRSIFSTAAPAAGFEAAAEPPVLVAGGDIAVTKRYEWDKADIARGVNVLVSLKERLEYFKAAEVSPEGPDSPRALTPTGATSVFIVHGRNEARKTEVARVLEKSGEYDVVILHEQPNRGRTLIEKFEGHAAESGYAVVLLTADDLGAINTLEQDFKLRARQNVVFELGFFFGALGRAQVAVLYEPQVELPSDINGLVYIELDDRGAWKTALIKELRAAGLDFDANRL